MFRPSFSSTRTVGFEDLQGAATESLSSNLITSWFGLLGRLHRRSNGFHVEAASPGQYLRPRPMVKRGSLCTSQVNRDKRGRLDRSLLSLPNAVRVFGLDFAASEASGAASGLGWHLGLGKPRDASFLSSANSVQLSLPYFAVQRLLCLTTPLRSLCRKCKQTHVGGNGKH